MARMTITDVLDHTTELDMKRDMDLVRKILLEVEKRGFQEVDADAFVEEGYDERTVASHFELLEEAGLIYASLLKVESEGTIGGSAIRLTSEGHDYLDAVRDNEVWEKTKKFLTTKTGSVAFDLSKAVALGYLRKKLGLPD